MSLSRKSLEEGSFVTILYQKNEKLRIKDLVADEESGNDTFGIRMENDADYQMQDPIIMIHC